MNLTDNSRLSRVVVSKDCLSNNIPSEDGCGGEEIDQ